MWLLLPSQKRDVRTQYYIAASKAFEHDRSEYIDSLKRTHYGKEGYLRSTTAIS